MQSNDQSYTAPPFPAFPCTSRYIPLGSVEEAFSRICLSIDTRETISLIVGPPGTGKSLICRLLAERYKQELHVVVLGETPIESRRELLNHLLHQLQIDSDPNVDPQLTLIDFLCGQDSAGRGLLVLVDEAQSLTREVIEAIRMVTNIMREGEPCVCTVLCGGMKFDEMLVDASMDAFTQRIATRCYLHALNAEETRRYICDTIQSCGSEPAETITSEAVAAVHHACSGIPRLINQMLTQAIDCAAESDEVLIDETIIDQAWAQLQQLPSPIVNDPKVSSKTAAIEFAELDSAMEFDQTSATFDQSAATDPEIETQPETTPQTAPSSDTEAEWDPITQIASGESNVFDALVNIGLAEASDETDVSAIAGALHNMGELEQLPEDRLVFQAFEESDSTSPTIGEAGLPGVDPIQSDIDIISDSENDRLEVETTVDIRPTISAKLLFGEFDEEEEISVGSGFPNRTPPAPAPKQDVKSLTPNADESLGTCQPCVPEFETKDQATAAIYFHETTDSSADLKSVDLASMDDEDAEISSIEAACCGTSPCENGFTNSETELEDVLHQEIIGIGQMTDSALVKMTDDLTNQNENILEWPEHPSMPNWAEPPIEHLADLKRASDGNADDRVNDFVVVTGHGELPIQPNASDSIDAEATPTLRVAEPDPQQQSELESESESESEMDATPQLTVESKVETEPQLTVKTHLEPESSVDPEPGPMTDDRFIRDDSDLLIIEDELDLRRDNAAARRDPKNKTISVDFQSMLSRMRSGTK
ncbi:MAG: AAA family ATPase [Planctomycetaceae bacterium]|nr:AAA family ATPase [Planctomycetaceae bacterium]